MFMVGTSRSYFENVPKMIARSVSGRDAYVVDIGALDSHDEVKDALARGSRREGEHSRTLFVFDHIYSKPYKQQGFFKAFIFYLQQSYKQRGFLRLFIIHSLNKSYKSIPGNSTRLNKKLSLSVALFSLVYTFKRLNTI